MKRNLLIAAIALLAVAFVSCQKDGVYKPKKKLAKITLNSEEVRYRDGMPNDTTTVNDFVREQWFWGKKTIESRIVTTHEFNNLTNSDEFLQSKYTYSYDDNNRITGFQEEEGIKAEYLYNGDKKLSEIYVYYGPNLLNTIELGYEDKHVSSIKITDNDYPNKKSESTLAMILPEQIVSLIYPEGLNCNEIVPKDVKTGVTDITIEWDGKNISRMVSTGNTNTTVTYEYDGKVNPFAGFYCDEDFSATMYSKNNVTKITSTSTFDYGNIAGKVEYTEDFVYEYDGSVPSSLKATRVTNSETTGVYAFKSSATRVNNKKYEYTK